MKAIVLTFDRQLGFVELLIKKYLELWDPCPFTFVVPFNDAAALRGSFLATAGDRVELRRSEADIRSTMTALLDGLPDEQWVYWCIDDRYPHSVPDPDGLRGVFEAVAGDRVPEVSCVKLVRWREAHAAESFDLGARRYYPQAASRLWGFWHHHFVRARVLRAAFLTDSLPKIYGIAQLNAQHHANQHPEFLGTVALPDTNLVTFAEPCRGRRLTVNGARDLAAYGCQSPAYPLIDQVRLFDQARLDLVQRLGAAAWSPEHHD